MKQQLIDNGKTLWEIQNSKNPTVWEVGRKYDPMTDSHNEVNGKPEFKNNNRGESKS
jgi:hypothetical protein